MSRAHQLLIKNSIREESIAATMKKVSLMDKARKLGQAADQKSTLNKVSDKVANLSQQAKPHVKNAIHAITTHPKTSLATAGALGAGVLANKIRRNRKARAK